MAFAGGLHDPVASLILCTPGYVDLSVINGEVVVRDGQLTTCDLDVSAGAWPGLCASEDGVGGPAAGHEGRGLSGHWQQMVHGRQAAAAARQAGSADLARCLLLVLPTVCRSC